VLTTKLASCRLGSNCEALVSWVPGLTVLALQNGAYTCRLPWLARMRLLPSA
jgi:hypothetical protein